MVDERTAAEAFGLLSDEIRLDVLRAIARAQHETPGTATSGLSFSDIYERVDVDGTSKLSYHLGELTGTFLRKTEGGYAFTHAGDQLVRFVLAGNYERPADIASIPTDGSCLHCGHAGLHATLDDQFFLVRCDDCDRPAFAYRVRPAQVRAHDGQALIDAVVAEHVGDQHKVRRGVCPDCAGRMTTEVVDAETAPGGAGVPVDFATVSKCQQCRRRMSVPLPYAVLLHPDAVAYHRDHGRGVLDTGAWVYHHHLAADDWRSSAVDETTATHRVTYDDGDESLAIAVGDDGAVVRTERARTANGR